MDNEDIFVFCDRCAERVYHPDSTNCIEEDGLIYCLACYEKLVQIGDTF